MRNSSAHTLIEMTVAMTIAMVISIAAAHVFHGNDDKAHATAPRHPHAAALNNHTEAPDA